MSEPREPETPMGIGQKYIRTKIGKDGKVTVEAFGFPDKTCHVATQDLTARLGRVTNTTEKDDGDAGNFQSVN